MIICKNAKQKFSDSASKTKRCCIRKYYFIGFFFSFTCFLSHFAKRKENVVREKGRKRKQHSTPNPHHCLLYHISG